VAFLLYFFSQEFGFTTSLRQHSAQASVMAWQVLSLRKHGLLLLAGLLPVVSPGKSFL
jgi:hypothetical protein